MKHILFLAVLVSLMLYTSCGGKRDYDTEEERDIKAYHKLSCPIVVKAKSPITSSSYGSVVLVDGDGYLLTINSTNDFGEAFVMTFKVGDTIDRCYPKMK